MAKVTITQHHRDIFRLYQHSQITKQGAIELLTLPIFDALENPPKIEVPVKHLEYKYAFTIIRHKTEIATGWVIVCIVRDQNDNIVNTFVTDVGGKRHAMGQLKIMGERIFVDIVNKAGKIDKLVEDFLNLKKELPKDLDLINVPFLVLEQYPEWKLYYQVWNGESFEGKKVLCERKLRNEVLFAWQKELGSYNGQDNRYGAWTVKVETK